RRIAGVLGARRYRGADRSRVAARADRLDQRSPAACSTRFEYYEVSGVAARCRTPWGYAEDARRRRRRLLLRLRQGRRRVLDRAFRELRGRQRACPEPKGSYRAGLEELHGYRNRDPSTEHLARPAGDAAGRGLSALPPRPGRAEPAEDLPQLCRRHRVSGHANEGLQREVAGDCLPVAGGPHALELRGVKIAVAARRAVFHGERQVPARFRNVSQVEVGKTQPELEFMVVGVAVDFTREQVSRGAEVPQAHRGEPAVEEME